MEQQTAADAAHLSGVVASFAQYSLFANEEADKRARHLAQLAPSAVGLL